MNPEGYSDRIQEEDQCLGRNSKHMQTSNSQEIMFRITLFFNVNKTHEHTMNLSDLLCVQLHNDNLKMFNQAWEEALQALGYDLDEHVVEHLDGRHVKKSTLMKHAMTLYQQDTVLKKKSREAAKLWQMTPTSSNSRTCWLLQKSDQETKQQQQHTLGKELRKMQRLSILDVKWLVLTRRKRFIRT